MSQSNHSPRSGAVAIAPPRLGSAIPSLRGTLARLGSRLAAYLRAYAQEQAEQRRARETVRRLAALSNRELKDMGLCRSEILSVAYGPRAPAPHAATHTRRRGEPADRGARGIVREGER